MPIMKKLVDSKRRYFISISFTLAILSMLNSCSKPLDNLYGLGGNPGGTGTKGSPGTNEVWIQGMAFSPSSITVVAGTTITWTNKDAAAHTVTSTAGLFNSPSLGTNGTYSRLFTTAGTYNYFCAVHPSMTATVIVN